MSVAIPIPPSEPELIEPEGGATVNGLAEVLYKASARYEEYVDHGQVATGSLVNGWFGDAKNAYAEAAKKTIDDHDTMATTLERVGRAVTAYADNLAEHLTTYSDLVTRKSDADLDREGLIQKIQAAPDEVSEEEIEHFRWEARQLSDRYRGIVTDHDALQLSVTENEDRLIEVFESATAIDDALSSEAGIPEDADDAIHRQGAPGTGASPEEVADWWESLTESEREAVIAAYPEVIGSADGLPASVRDDANRIVLEDDLATLNAKKDDGTLSDDEEKALANAEDVRDALKDADSFTDPLNPDYRPGGTLFIYDPYAYDGDGKVAIGIGDLDNADDVAILTPGIGTEVSDVGTYTDRVEGIYESTRYNGDKSSVATLFYLGYDTPDGLTDSATRSSDRAEQGGENLANTIDGLRASREDNPAHLTAIGHSYGSTTTAYAVGSEGADVDDVVLIGSPGAGPAEDAGDLGGKDHVYVGRDGLDPVAFLGDEGFYHNPGGLGIDPSSEDFDATRFEAEGKDKGSVVNQGAHSSYFDDDSESLYNIGKIVDGHGDDVNEASQSYDRPGPIPPNDPEQDRDSSTNEPGRSDTTDR